MATTVGTFQFDAPPGFRTEDVTMGMRLPNFGTGVAPSIIMQSKPARPGATLEALAGETLAELTQTVPNMKQGSHAELAFDDGGKGVVLSYGLTTGHGELRQYFVLRLHEGQLCTATLTVPTTGLTEGSAMQFMKALTSIRPS